MAAFPCATARRRDAVNLASGIHALARLPAKAPFVELLGLDLLRVDQLAGTASPRRRYPLFPGSFMARQQHISQTSDRFTGPSWRFDGRPLREQSHSATHFLSRGTLGRHRHAPDATSLRHQKGEAILAAAVSHFSEVGYKPGMSHSEPDPHASIRLGPSGVIHSCQSNLILREAIAD